MSFLTGRVSNESGEQRQKDVLAKEVGGRVALVDSPVAGCEIAESCLSRNADNTVNPVIRQIYGVESPATTLPHKSVDWSNLLNNIPR